MIKCKLCVLDPNAIPSLRCCCLWLYVGMFQLAALIRLAQPSPYLLLWVRDANRYQPLYAFGLGAILLVNYSVLLLDDVANCRRL